MIKKDSPFEARRRGRIEFIRAASAEIGDLSADCGGVVSIRAASAEIGDLSVEFGGVGGLCLSALPLLQVNRFINRKYYALNIR
jgi:hypothetical protein